MQCCKKDHYEPILRNQAMNPEIVTRMNTCVPLSEETTNPVNKWGETTDEKYERLEKERVGITLNREQYGSVFGHMQTETTVSEVSEESHSPSLLSSGSSK